MSKPFRLNLLKIQCLAEQLGEPGKDEIYIFGVGVTSKGDRFSIAPQKLGNFSTGNSVTLQRTLVDIHVHDQVHWVNTCLWLFERDSGKLANGAAAIQEEFDRLMVLNLDFIAPLGLGDAQYPYALARTAMGMRRKIIALADGWNNDEVSDPVILDHPVRDMTLPGPQRYTRPFIGAGTYQLEFSHHLELISPILA